MAEQRSTATVREDSIHSALSQLHRCWRQVFVFYRSVSLKEISRHGVELKVITKAQKGVRKSITKPCDPQSICGWRKKQWTVCFMYRYWESYWQGFPEKGSVFPLHIYPSSFCCDSEALLTNHDVMEISRPPYLPDLVPADLFFLFPKVKTTPLPQTKGKISGHRRQQEYHNCRINGRSFGCRRWLVRSFQKYVRSVFQSREITVKENKTFFILFITCYIMSSRTILFGFIQEQHVINIY